MVVMLEVKGFIPEADPHYHPKTDPESESRREAHV
jgi:hypothetical protein